jgi:hypothetical protein
MEAQAPEKDIMRVNTTTVCKDSKEFNVDPSLKLERAFINTLTISEALSIKSEVPID